MTHDVRLATSGRPWLSTIRPALRLHDDVAHRLVGGHRLVVVAADDLEVVEPHEERREEREDEGLHHHQAQAAALRAVDRTHQADVHCGSSRPKSFISGGSTNGVSRTSQTTATTMTWSSSATDQASPSSSPVSAKIEVPMNDAAATVATTATAVGSHVLAHAGGQEGDDGQRQRPAAGDVVGGRREVERDPGREAEEQGGRAR